MTQLEIIHVSGHAVSFDLVEAVAYVPAIHLHQIVSGFVCLNDPREEKRWKDWRVKVETRIYPPYSLLTMSIEPIGKGWASEFMVNTVDFKLQPNQFAWLKQHVAQFYLDCLESDGPRNIDMSQLALTL